MKTGKFYIKPAQSYQNRKEEKSYVPVSFSKNTGFSGGKPCPEDKHPLVLHMY